MAPLQNTLPYELAFDRFANQYICINEFKAKTRHKQYRYMYTLRTEHCKTYEERQQQVQYKTTVT